jgi:hypothetical protein
MLHPTSTIEIGTVEHAGIKQERSTVFPEIPEIERVLVLQSRINDCSPDASA